MNGLRHNLCIQGKGQEVQAWQAFEEVTDTFVHLSLHPFENININSSHFTAIERFIVVLYDRTSPLSFVNDAREELFCKKNRAVDRLPPTQDALLQHTSRSLYHAGIWTTSIQTQQVIPSPEEFSWTKSSCTWVPIWISIPEASKACRGRELIKCHCKGDCSNCTCAKANIACSPLCNCKCIILHY